ncbi:hypothetical protein ABIA06_003905 [Bradyrhizobium yuanmingense]|uniref:Uncharacterized protein n=1 Tax=Bradyrhizobium yuanmingense TaxID=108015 RepID=A0A1C3V5P9_9BRAD|nr:hypothetical protein IQ15_03860 [Bradyrhizobium yuanmingense]SCB23092.1 hypothetical protein GA0061099_1003226 [Bradyrhizobium yuanmingense]
MDMGVGVIVPVRMSMAVTMGMAMSMVVLVGVGRGGSHLRTLYYNITPVHGGTDIAAQGLPITMAMAAATNGNGTETAQRNQTKRAGMNGISHKITRWKANSAQATT